MSQTIIINADTVHEIYINIAYYMFYPTPIDSTTTSRTFYHVAYYILAVQIIDHITILILLLILEYLTTIDRRFYPYPSDTKGKRVSEMMRIREVY